MKMADTLSANQARFRPSIIDRLIVVQLKIAQ
jgi:hypothetical protein